MKGRRVLITGGLGFVGSNLAHACHALGAEVTVYDCLDPLSGGNLANLAGIQKDIRIVQDDIRSPSGLATVIQGQDLVFHCAAYTSHPNSMKDPQVDVDVNCKGTLNVLEALRYMNPTARMVHVGTTTQIGPMLYSPIDEDHPEFPSDIYSANKSVAEKYVLTYGRAYGLPVSVVRLSNTYGPRASIRNPDLGFINYFFGLALQGKDLQVFGDGAQIRTLVYVADAVDALIKAALSDRAIGRVYFAAGAEQLTVAEIAQAIVDEVGGAVRFVPWPEGRKNIEVGDAAISSRRIHDELAWTPRFDIKTGLAETKAYYSAQPDAYL